MNQPIPIKVFVSYAQEDESFKKELDIQLKLIGMQIPIKVWTKDKIIAGQIRNDEINNALQSADIVLLLVSNNFLVSDENNFQVKRSLELYTEGKVTVISIILRPTPFTNHELGKFLALPKLAKPISTWSDKDEAWLDVSEGLKKVFNSITEKKANSTQSNLVTTSTSNQSNTTSNDNITLQHVKAEGDANITINQNVPTSSQNSSSTLDEALTIFKEARSLIGTWKMKEAIELLSQYTESNGLDSERNDLILQSGKLSNIEKEKQRGTRSSSEIGVEMSRINYALLSMVTDLEKDVKNK